MLVFPCIWESLVQPNLCLNRTTMVREDCSRRGHMSIPWAGELQSFLSPEGPHWLQGVGRLKLSLQWNPGQQIAKSTACENRPLLGELYWCCIISCYPLSVVFLFPWLPVVARVLPDVQTLVPLSGANVTACFGQPCLAVSRCFHANCEQWSPFLFSAVRAEPF